MLPIPLPISVIAVARSTAPGSGTSAPPIEPICTKRSGRPSGVAFAAVTSSARALAPHR